MEATNTRTVASEPVVKKHRIDSKPEPLSKLRKYDPDYIKWGFVSVGQEKQPDILCVVCQAVLRNSSLVPTKLRHFMAKHPDLTMHPLFYFEQLA